MVCMVCNGNIFYQVSGAVGEAMVMGEKNISISLKRKILTGSLKIKKERWFGKKLTYCSSCMEKGEV